MRKSRDNSLILLTKDGTQSAIEELWEFWILHYFRVKFEFFQRLFAISDDDLRMTKDTISDHISFLEFGCDFPFWSWPLSHDIVFRRIDLFSDRAECPYSLRLQIFLHTREDGANSVDKSITSHSLFELDSTFEIIDFLQEWRHELR